MGWKQQNRIIDTEHPHQCNCGDCWEKRKQLIPQLTTEELHSLMCLAGAVMEMYRSLPWRSVMAEVFCQLEGARFEMCNAVGDELIRREKAEKAGR